MKKVLIIGGVLVLTGVLVIGAATIGYQRELSRNAGSGDAKVFTVKEGETAGVIAERLEAEGLIRSRTIFLIHLRINGLETEIKAGTYIISPAKTLREVTDILTQGEVATKKVTIPEGLTIKKMAEKMEAADIVERDEFLKAAEGKEGYLFPDTYIFPYGISAEDVVKAMLKNFETKITKEMEAGFAKSGFNQRSAVTLASIVELETGKSETERRIVAGIYINRLSLGIKLQADATINYITGKNEVSSSFADLSIDSPYNTYKYAGLPPGPIGAPGLSALNAVAFYTDTDYLFYCHDTAGNIYYGKNEAEHNANRLKCLGRP